MYFYQISDMSTFLFDKIVFGPVKSRRLGVSLGMNLLPTDVKICNFDCIYCECGWSGKQSEKKSILPSREEIKMALETRLKEMESKAELPDYITFAGNGEPTMHPDFDGIIDDTLILRNKYCPEAGIAVLSNATLLHKENISRALQKVDQNILKLDTINEESFKIINKPARGIFIKDIIAGLINFKGKVIIQTLFFRSVFGGVKIDNTSSNELEGLISTYKLIKPEKIMIYTFERDTAAEGLEKVSLEELMEIKNRLVSEGFLVELSA
jgi:wyosine [tRNA(Phe)-imidazoG37] synthetase (radical SAM superfamily)